MKKEVVIAKVWFAKRNNQRFVTVPAACDIEPGTYVRLVPILDRSDFED